MSPHVRAICSRCAINTVLFDAPPVGEVLCPPCRQYLRALEEEWQKLDTTLRGATIVSVVAGRVVGKESPLGALIIKRGDGIFQVEFEVDDMGGDITLGCVMPIEVRILTDREPPT